MRLFRPTLRIRMALLYGGLVLLVGVSLLVHLARPARPGRSAICRIFSTNRGTVTITDDRHAIYAGSTRARSARRRAKSAATTCCTPA